MNRINLEDFLGEDKPPRRDPFNSHQPPFNPPRPPSNSPWRRTKAKTDVLKTISFIARMALIAIGVGFAWLNIQPYDAIVRMIFGAIAGTLPFEWVLSVPVIGDLIARLGNGLALVAGTILWAVFQIFEIIPLVLWATRSNIEVLIAGIEENHHKFNVSDEDHPLVKKLKKTYNELPIALVRQATRRAIYAYTADFILCFLRYPFIYGGLAALPLFMLAPSLNDVDGKNLVIVATSLFVVELVAISYLWIHNLQITFGRKPRINQP